MMKRLVLVLSMIGMVGCSGSMSGTVGGVSLNVADAIFAVIKDQQGKSTAAFVVLADKPKICESLKANREPKGATSLSFIMFRTSDSDVLAPDVGDYTVSESLQANGAGFHATTDFAHNDSNCANTVSSNARSGKSGLIKLTNFKGEANGSANGTYDITFGAGDKVTGSFNATYCDVSVFQNNPNCE